MARYMLSHPNEGYDFFTEERLTAVLPVCARKRVKIIGNMGSRNPKAAQNLAIDIAQRLGLKGMRIAAVWGDDVLELIKELNPDIAMNERENRQIWGEFNFSPRLRPRRSDCRGFARWGRCGSHGASRRRLLIFGAYGI